MKLTTWFHLGIAILTMVFVIAVCIAWQAARRDQAQLQEKLHSAQQQLIEATARQETRRVALETQLAAIRKQKAAIRSPQQIVKALPEVLALPEPITLEPAGSLPPAPQLGEHSASNQLSQATQSGNASTQADTSNDPRASPSQTAPNAQSSRVKLPTEDLKPLYDFALECKACQARLAAAQADLKDEQTKTQALKRERDDALYAARGGSVLRRIGHAAKWFVIGAAVGAAAAKYAH